MTFSQLIESVTPVFEFFAEIFSVFPPVIILLGTSVFGICVFFLVLKLFRR